MRERTGATESEAVTYVRWLAVAYVVFLVYCSVVDVGSSSGWRMPTQPLWSFLFEFWTPKITLFDVVANILAYLPIGALLTWTLPAHWPATQRCLSGALLGLALSFSMESLQMWLPTRDPSPVDLCTNFIGSALGALVAVLQPAPRQPLASIRSAYRRLLIPGTHSNDCLLALLVWLLLASYPFLPRVDGGQVLHALQPLSSSFFIPSQWQPREIVYLTCAICGLGLLLQQAKREAQSLAGLYCATLTVSVLLQPFIVGHVLTSEYVYGVVLGLLAFSGIIRLRPQPSTLRCCGWTLVVLAYASFRLTAPAADLAQFDWSLRPRTVLPHATLIRICGNAFIVALTMASIVRFTQGRSLSLLIGGVGLTLLGFIGLEYALAFFFARNGLLAPALIACGAWLIAWRPLDS
jgi:hypothetical protein